MKQLEKKKRIRTKKMSVAAMTDEQLIKLFKEKNIASKSEFAMPAEDKKQEVRKSVNGHAEMEYYYKNLQVYAELGSRLESAVNRLVKLPSTPVSAQDKEEPVSCFADVLANNNNIFASYNNRLERLLTTLESFI